MSAAQRALRPRDHGPETQLLLTPLEFELVHSEQTYLRDTLPVLRAEGFEVQIWSGFPITVTGVPARLSAAKTFPTKKKEVKCNKARPRPEYRIMSTTTRCG